MTSPDVYEPDEDMLLTQYVNWVFDVCRPTALEYGEDESWVTIRTNFQPKTLCRQCLQSLCPYGEVLKIAIQRSDNGLCEMKLWNRDIMECNIISKTEEFRMIAKHIELYGFSKGNSKMSYFSAVYDEDDPSLLYVCCDNIPSPQNW